MPQPKRKLTLNLHQPPASHLLVVGLLQLVQWFPSIFYIKHMGESNIMANCTFVTALGEWSQPAGQGFWSPGHISETTVDPPSDANNSAASPRASPLSANITAPSPPQWSPVSITNSLSATPTDTPTHAAAGRSQTSGQTGFQVRRARKLFYISWRKKKSLWYMCDEIKTSFSFLLAHTTSI